MSDKLQDLEDEIFDKYPDWRDKLKFIDYLHGNVHGKGSPHVIVETPFAQHKVSIGNLRKGNFPTRITAIDKQEFENNNNMHMIRILGEEVFLLKPE